MVPYSYLRSLTLIVVENIDNPPGGRVGDCLDLHDCHVCLHPQIQLADYDT